MYRVLYSLPTLYTILYYEDIGHSESLLIPNLTLTTVIFQSKIFLSSVVKENLFDLQ